MTENTEKYKDYIQHTIISYLKRMMDGWNQSDETIGYVTPANRVPHDSVYKSVLHTMMEPGIKGTGQMIPKDSFFTQ